MDIVRLTVGTIVFILRPIIIITAYLIVRSGGERGVAAQQDVQNHADSPYVNLEMVEHN